MLVADRNVHGCTCRLDTISGRRATQWRFCTAWQFQTSTPDGEAQSRCTLTVNRRASYSSVERIVRTCAEPHEEECSEHPENAWTPARWTRRGGLPRPESVTPSH